MSSLHSITDKMVKVWQSFQNTWDITRDSWKDRDRDLFEREHVNELRQGTNLYISCLRRFAENIESIMSELP
jgi:hypothetical protein